MKISSKLFKPTIFLKSKINPYPNPLKIKEKIKIFKNRPIMNFNFLRRRNSQNAQSTSRLEKNKSSFRQTSLGSLEKMNLPIIKTSNIRKKRELKFEKINSVYFNTINKIGNSNQATNETEFIKKKTDNIIDADLDKETINKKDITFNEDLNNVDISEIIENIIKEYSDIGKLIKVCFFIDKQRIIEYKKNEHVILKIIAKDLKDNYGLDIKEFILNNKKLNEFKSLKDNNIVNNSIIKVII